MNSPSLDLANLPTFPCNEAKVPLAAKGFKSARHGANATLWPLVAFATGAMSGIDVLDIDPHGRDWFDQNFDAIPQTRAHATQRGLHLLFRHAEGLRCSTNRIALGVDVRADGGYAIYWPREGFAVEDWPLCEWPDWLLQEAMHRGIRRNPDTKLSPPLHSDVVEDFTEALFKLDPICWRGDGSEEGYLGWLALMSACKAAGIAVEDFVEWSTRDPVYAGDGDVIRRKWEGVEPKHDGVLRAALKAAHIKVRGRHNNILGMEGINSVRVPFNAAPTINLPLRTKRIINWLASRPDEQRLFNAACMFAEIVHEHRMRVGVAVRLLEEAAKDCGLWKQLGKDGVARSIANGLRHVEEKMLER